MANRLLDAIDPDKVQDTESADQLMDAAVRPLASNPDLRARLTEMQARHEQAIDDVSVDTVIEAGFTDEASRLLVRSFEEFIAEHKDEITALQIIYSIPRRDTARSALTFDELKQLSEALSQPPRSWTTETLWWRMPSWNATMCAAQVRDAC